MSLAVSELLNGVAQRATAILRPWSFKSLVSFGFVVVAGLPTLAFLVASYEIGRLAENAQMIIEQSVRPAQGIRGLVQQLTTMERSARRHVVLGEQEGLKSYHDTREEFVAMLAQELRTLSHDPARQQGLAALGVRERGVYERLRGGAPRNDESRAALGQLVALADQARAVLTESNRIVGQRVEALQQRVERTRWWLLGHGFLLISVAALLAAMLYVAVTHSRRQVDDTIRRLGSGNFDAPVRIRGPRDLEELGRRLEWLRLRLQDLEQQKVRFLRHVSHELKTPLTTLREGSDLLAEQVLGPLDPAQIEVAGILQQSTLRLQKLIEELLAFNRLVDVRDRSTAGKPVILDQVVRVVATDYRLVASRKELAITTALDHVETRGDERQLQALVDNLLSNAVKYTPTGGRIEVTLRQRGDSVTLEVWNSGSNVKPTDRQRIFEPFYTVGGESAGTIQGSGLGLSIARECVQSHGGQLEVVATDQEGTRFRATLPVAAPNDSGRGQDHAA